jgi:hypothetical protein
VSAMIADVEEIANAVRGKWSQEFKVNWSLSKTMESWEAQDVRGRSEVAEGPCCENEKLRWWGCGPGFSGGLDVWSSPLESGHGARTTIGGKVRGSLQRGPDFS